MTQVLKTRRIIAAILALCLVAPTVHGQPAKKAQKDDWTTVMALPPATRVRVQTKAGMKHEGPIASVSAMQLALSDGITVGRDEVASVDILKGKGPGNTGKKIALGAGIGAGVGAGFGFAVGDCDTNSCFFSRGETMVITAILGATVGVLSGFVVSMFRGSSTRIYRAK